MDDWSVADNNTPSLPAGRQHSNTPILQHSNSSMLHYSAHPYLNPIANNSSFTSPYRSTYS